MRRDARRHAHRDAGGPIREKVREARGKNNRFFVILIIGWFEIDGILTETIQQKLRGLRHSAFRITHRGGAIAIDIAEITLAIDQRIANREVLGEAHHGIVDRSVAMRVIVTHHFTHDFSTLAIAAVWVQLQLAHAVQNSSLNRLQAIAHIGQGP